MTDDRWQRIEEVFHRAVELAADALPAFLDRACGMDLLLRREVESLLRHQKEDGSTFASPPGEPPTESVVARTLSVGDRLGPYEITGFIGAGGMGEVYRAHEPRLRRDIALKVLPIGVGEAPERRRRFEREAQAVAAVSHPCIAAIYGLEDSGGACAIAMELVEGSTLADRIGRGRIPIEELLAIAKQIAEALEYAHEKSIVHRDLKPANIMLTPEGHVKLLDFGLAQWIVEPESETDPLTGRGQIAGTIGYISPEQLLGLPADRRTDLFSFGVVLYEMVARERPFVGSSPITVVDAILHGRPRDLSGAMAPGELKDMIWKLLEKEPANRYTSAAEVRRELQAVESSLTVSHPEKLSANARVAIWVAVVVIVVLAGWFWRRSARERWARDTMPEIVRLAENGEYAKAAALSRQARAVLPKDPTLEKLWRRATEEVSFDSVPPGAEVSIRSYRDDPNTWQTIGKTPLKKIRVPRDDYVWQVVKPGFAAIFLVGGPNAESLPGFHPNFNWTLKLRPEASVPPDMVVVAGGAVSLGYPLGTARATVRIDDFLIDRHEVTNEEYKRFVDAGGYSRRELWTQPFVRDGRAVPWEDAMALFHDATGRPGPAAWEDGSYPRGREKYPVAEVSWYEAAAYAGFAGKSLPTAYHWTWASQSGRETPLIAAGSNFRRDGTQPVGSVSATSGFGTTDMAGNVKEWCWNEARDGKRLMLGGGFGEPEYMFNHTDAQSPWDRLANFGFRCVKLDSPGGPKAVAHIEGTARDYWKEKPVPDDVFKAYTGLYAYDKGDLNALVEPTVAMEAWSRTKVIFDAAYGHERVPVYLFLPKNGSPPFQTVVYFPGAGGFGEDKLDLSRIEDANDFLLKSGRALIVPIYKGMYERRDGYVVGRIRPAFFRDHVIAWSKDLRRSLDYLETRKEFDVTRVAYFGASLGAAEAPVLSAIEPRIKTAIMLSGGFQPTRLALPEIEPLNFAPRTTIPVLMLNGRYDATFPLESSQNPLFHFIGTPNLDKKHVIYEGGHGAFPRPAAVRECLDWLDRYLGPVRR